MLCFLVGCQSYAPRTAVLVTPGEARSHVEFFADPDALPTSSHVVGCEVFLGPGPGEVGHFSADVPFGDLSGRFRLAVAPAPYAVAIRAGQPKESIPVEVATREGMLTPVWVRYKQLREYSSSSRTVRHFVILPEVGSPVPFDSPGSTASLVVLLGDTTPRVRWLAAYLLGCEAGVEAIAALERMAVMDASEENRVMARRALVEIKEKTGK